MGFYKGHNENDEKTRMLGYQFTEKEQKLQIENYFRKFYTSSTDLPKNFRDYLLRAKPLNYENYDSKGDPQKVD